MERVLEMENRQEMTTGRWKLILVAYVLLLIVFGMSTPFDFSWPHVVELKEVNISTSESVSRMEQGNMKRRLALVAVALFAVYSLARTENRFRFNLPSGLLLLFYLGWVQLSLSWSVDVPFTLRRLVTVDILWLLAVVFAARYSLRELAIISVLVAGTSLALGVANELRWGTINPLSEHWRFSGIYHTVSMGWNCGILALSAMFLVTDEEHGGRRFLLWLILVVAIVFLLLTKSRMAVASTLFCMGIYWYRIVPGPNRFFLVLVPVIVLCLAYLILGDLLLSYGVDASTLGRGEDARESMRNLTGRLPLWIECFKWITERPIRGFGFNSFISPKNLHNIARNVGWTPNSLHSGYIDAMMGLGYVGAMALISFLLAALVRAYRLSVQLPEYIFVVSVLVWLCLNLLIGSIPITRPEFITFFCMALLARVALMPAAEWERKR